MKASKRCFCAPTRRRPGTGAGAPRGLLAGLAHMVAAARASSFDCHGQRQARDRASPFKRRCDLQQECFLGARRSPQVIVWTKCDE